MQIVDRRLNPKAKSLGNRQRFLRRAKAEIREAIKDSLKSRKVSEAEGAEKVTIRSKSLREPSFSLGPQHRRARLRAARQRGIPGRRRDPQAAGRRRRSRQPGQPRRRGPGRVHLHPHQGRVPRPLLRRPEAAEPDQGQAQGPEGAQAGARRLHHRRPARPPQSHPHHAQEPRPPHGAAAPEPGRDRAARGGAGGRRGREPADDAKIAELRAAARAQAAPAPQHRLHRSHRPAVQPLRAGAQADHPGGHVLPDGRLGLHDRAAQGPGQALLHAAARVPDALLPRGAHRLHPPHQHGRRGRRGDLLPRHRDRRHRHLHGARGDAEGRARALLARRLEHLRGAGLRRRQLPRRHAALPGAARRGDPAGLPVFRLHRDDARRALQRHGGDAGLARLHRGRPPAPATSPCGGWRRRRTSSRCSTSCSRRAASQPEERSAGGDHATKKLPKRKSQAAPAVRRARSGASS